MAKTYFGLRGRGLATFMFWTTTCPVYLLFGWNNGVAGGLLDLPAWIKTFPEIDTLTTTGSQQAHNSTLQGAVVSMYTLGCFFGSLSCIFLGDYLGRIKTIAFGAVVVIAGAVLQCSSYSLAQLIVGRLITGLGYGGISATMPNWQNECAAAGKRSALTMYIGVFVGSAMSISAWLNFGMSHTHGPVTWRFALALAMFWALPVATITPFLPESPRWLLKQRREDEAREVLSALTDTDLHSEEVNFVVQEVQTSLAITGQARFRDVLTKGQQRLFHRLCIATVCQTFQMLTGCNAMAFYMARIFIEDLGLSPDLAGILTAIFFLIIALSSPVGVVTVDRVGRRKLLMICSTVLGICMAIVSGTLSKQKQRAFDIVVITCMYVYQVAFAIGWMGLPFLYCAEIAPLSHRVPITAVSTGTTWLWSFVVALITPVGLSNLASKYYIIYAVINLFLIVPVVYFFFPETKGRSLEEVDVIFKESKSIFDTVKVAREPRTVQPLTLDALEKKESTVDESSQHVEAVHDTA